MSALIAASRAAHAGSAVRQPAFVLADELRHADTRAAVAAFGARRRPRVEWVREQSQALTDLVRLPAAVRDRGLRDRGVSAFHDRYRPLVAAP